LEILLILTQDPVKTIAISKTNKWFVTGSADRSIKFWDFNKGNLLHCIETAHDGIFRRRINLVESVMNLEISEDEKMLFSFGGDMNIKFWDLETKTVISSYKDSVWSMMLL
jgi:pleiotropic regulator 1